MANPTSRSHHRAPVTLAVSVPSAAAAVGIECVGDAEFAGRADAGVLVVGNAYRVPAD